MSGKDDTPKTEANFQIGDPVSHEIEILLDDLDDSPQRSIGGAISIYARSAKVIRELQRQLATEKLLTKNKYHPCFATIGADPPNDCNWPYCGCDPHTDRIIDGLKEIGWKSPEEEKHFSTVINGIEICGAPSLGHEFVCSLPSRHDGKHSWDRIEPVALPEKDIPEGNYIDDSL